ncbi:major facilitator superfamily domain-containing protein [Xylariaceae sp. FL1651]|nr:major facilitator superfamily domain-containing protein [Xylariaceae sp. FL1651]
MDKATDEGPSPSLVIAEINEPVATINASKPAQLHQFNEQANYVPRRTIITIFLACASVDLIALIDQTTLAASLYIVANALGGGNQAAWIANGFFITSTVGQLLYGRLSDIWSRKVILLIGLAIFFIGSLASSLANTVTQLIVFRALTGIGGGGLMTVAQLIVSDVVPLRERGKYQGILGAVVAIANGIGPIIGGALSSASKNGWRNIFRLGLPLTVLTTLCVIFFMPLKKVEGDWKLKLKAVDFLGIVLTLAGTTIFLLGLTWGGVDYPWDSAHVIATLVVGFALSVAFVLWQWKGAKYPLIPLHVFKSRIVNGACLTMAINGWNFVVQVGRYRECVLFGWLAWAVGLGLMSTLDEHSGLGKQVGYSLLIGVGVGNTLQPALIAVQAGVERRDMAVVTSFRNFVRNLGATLGLAIGGTLLNNIVANSLSALSLSDDAAKSLLSSPQTYLSSLPPDEADHVRMVLIPAYRHAFRVIFLLGASLAALAFVLAFTLMPQVELSRSDDGKLKEEGRKQHLKEKEKEKDQLRGSSAA